MGVFHPIRVWVAPGQEGRTSWAGTGWRSKIPGQGQDLPKPKKGRTGWSRLSREPMHGLVSGHGFLWAILKISLGPPSPRKQQKRLPPGDPPPTLRNCSVSHWGSWDLTLTLAPLSPHFPHLLGWLFCSLPESLCSRGHQV